MSVIPLRPKRFDPQAMAIVVALAATLTGCGSGEEPAQPTGAPPAVDSGTGDVQQENSQLDAVDATSTLSPSSVKVSCQYRFVTDGTALGRSVDDVVGMLEETHTDFVFQGWLVQLPCPDRCSDLTEADRADCDEKGYSYEYLKDAVAKIKQQLPQAIFCGGTQAEFLYPDFASGTTDEERRDKAWTMALDPTKWGLSVTKREVQCNWAKRWGMVDKDAQCPTEEDLKATMVFYYPDLSNPDFQTVFLEKLHKQVDVGVDAMWIDMLYTQAAALKELAGDETHAAVQDSYRAASEIVDRIHQYGEQTRGRRIYVSTWVVVGKASPLVLMHPDPNVDIAMASPSAEEILDSNGIVGQFNEAVWDERLDMIRQKAGGMPLFARIDYGGAGRTPLHAFSQELTMEQQREFLRKADEFYTRKGIHFIYPVHGGDMGTENLTRKSYGKYNWYDSLAPEFQTYETIKQLAQSKSSR
jgi:hypothetical protein